MQFKAVGTSHRSLAAHLLDFAQWLERRRPAMHALTLGYEHIANPGYVLQHLDDWFCTELQPEDWAALLSVLVALNGAQLVELQIEVRAFPAGALYEAMPFYALQLPRLEALTVMFPRVGLMSSLTHLTRLRTLMLVGTELDAWVELPASLTELRCECLAVDE